MNVAWKVWLPIAGLVTALYFVGPNTPETRLFLFNGLGFLSVAMVVAGAGARTGGERRAWLWIAAGLGSFATADVVYYVLERQAGLTGPSFPSIADGFYLAMYPLVFAGLVLMSRALSPSADRTSTIIAGATGVVAFIVMWMLFADSVFGLSGTGLPYVVSLAYPLMGATVIAAGARLLLTGKVNEPSFALMIAAVVALTVADSLYNIALNNGTYRTGTLPDFFWLIFNVCFALAALLPRTGSVDLSASSLDRVGPTSIPAPAG